MQSTTTFLAAVNSVLRAVGQNPLSATTFASPDGQSGAREVMACKAIVLEAYNELLNKQPSTPYRKEAQLRIYPAYTTGKIRLIASDATASTILGFQAPSACDVDWNATTYPPFSDPKNVMIQVGSENQWYRGYTLGAGDDLIVRPPMVKYNDFPLVTACDDGLPYRIVPFRYALPSDFRDIVSVSNPFVGGRVERVGPERMTVLRAESIANDEMVDETDPLYFAIDLLDSGAYGIHIYPAPSTIRVLTIHYLTVQTVPTLHSDFFALPEDLIPELLSRSKAIASMEILGDGERAGFFKQTEMEKRRDDTLKNLERGPQRSMRSNAADDYRSFYREDGGEWR